MARMVSTVDRICEELDRESRGIGLVYVVKEELERSLWGDDDRGAAVLAGVLLSAVGGFSDEAVSIRDAVGRASKAELLDALRAAAAQVAATVAQREAGN